MHSINLDNLEPFSFEEWIEDATEGIITEIEACLKIDLVYWELEINPLPILDQDEAEERAREAMKGILNIKIDLSLWEERILDSISSLDLTATTRKDNASAGDGTWLDERNLE